MTKPLSKKEKANRAKLMAAQRHLAANIEAEINAKNKAGGLTPSELADMNAAVAYIRQTNYSSVEDVHKNVKRLNIYSVACGAIASAVERDLIHGYRHPSAPEHEAERYYPAGGKAPVGKATAKKKAAPKVKEEIKLSKDQLEDMEELVTYITEKCLDDDHSVTHGELCRDLGISSKRVVVATANALKLGRIIYSEDDDGYRMAKKPSKPMVAARAAVRSLEEELVRCNQELRREKDKVEALDGLYMTSCDDGDKLRSQREKLRNRATGLELQVEEQHATLRIERFEHGLLCKRIALVARLLERQHEVLTDGVEQYHFPSRKSRKLTITDWADWVGEQAQELLAILNTARKWGRDTRADRIVLLRGGLGGDGLWEAQVGSLHPVRPDEVDNDIYGSASNGEMMKKPEYKTKIRIEKKTKAKARRRT